MLMTDGPFAEGKEHIGGFCIIKAPDLDAALEWGRKVARAITLPIEVRPFHGEHADRRVPASPTSEIERVFREEYGRAVAVLVRVFGDIDLAEEAVQDAFTVAVQRWPSDRAAAEPGGMDHHHRPQPGDRPAPPGGVPRGPARPGRAAARRATNRPRRAPCPTTDCA